MNDMMTLEERIQAFFSLGQLLRDTFPAGSERTGANGHAYSTMLTEAFKETSARNPWFTEEFTRHALREWGRSLTAENLDRWIAPYGDAIRRRKKPADVAVITAGNIPLVGFHDFLCTLLSGNVFTGKLSKDDSVLLPALARLLCSIEPGFEPFIRFTEDKLGGFDAVIATGSNNTSRYFEYYFGKYPHIIRRNRNGVALLNGGERPEQLAALGDDLCLYFGMGCRSVSKVFIPRGYDHARLFEAVDPYRRVLSIHHRFMNNYTYNKAVYLLSEIPHHDNGCLLLVESERYPSPVAVVHYEFYDSLAALIPRLQLDRELIQCIASDPVPGLETVTFGETQHPALWDYADGVDTMQFLTDLPG